MKKTKLTITGMHCGSCAGNIEASIKKLPGIQEVSVSVMTNKAIVVSEETVSEEALKEAVKKAGYDVVEVE